MNTALDFIIWGRNVTEAEHTLVEMVFKSVQLMELYDGENGQCFIAYSYVWAVRF
jgi:hypothetical protein